MSTTRKFVHSVLGCDVAIDAPATPQDFDKVFGLNACLSNACSKAAYSFWNNSFYPMFMAALAEKTGVEIPNDGDKTVKVKQDDGSYADVPAKISAARYKKLLVTGDHITESECKVIAQEIADKIGPLTPGEGRAKKPSDDHYAAARMRMGQDEYSFETFASAFNSKNSGYTGEEILASSESELDAVAKMYMLNEQRTIAEAKAANAI